MKNRFTTHLTALAAVTMLLFGAGQGLAATAAGTDIENTVSVSFTINGGTPPAVTASETFKVDEKIDVVVDWDNSVTLVVPSGTGYGLHFTVTNLSNSAAGSNWFQLTTEDGTGFDMTAVQIWEDTDGNGTPDTDLTAAPYIQIDVDDIRDIYIVATAPDNTIITATAQTGQHHLIATAWAGGTLAAGKLSTDDPGNAGNDKDEVERIYVDSRGTAAIEIANPDGIHSDFGVFESAWTTMGVTKEASTPDYFIPGAIVTYTVTVTNPDTTNPSTVTISDMVPDSTTFSGSLTCSSGTPKYSTDARGSNPTSVNYGIAPADPTTVNYVQCENGTAAINNGTATMSFAVQIN